MELPLTEKEIEFMEHFYTPTSMTENLIPVNENAPHCWNEKEDCIYEYPYQEMMQNFSYLVANDSELKPEVLALKKKGAGDCFSIGSRNTGKSFFLKIDVFLTWIHKVKEACLASFDQKHLSKVADPIAAYIESHPFAKIFHLKKGATASVNRKHGGLRAVSEHGCLIEGANEKVEGNNPGTDFHSKHYEVFWYEEACVDRNTLVRIVDKNGLIRSEFIGKLINSGEWKDVLIYSYNFEKRKLELKPIINIFKKTIPHYSYWDLKVENFGNTEYRRLITSQNQKIYTDNGYKQVEELNIGDKLYSIDYDRLSDLQKQILIGTLLGDACINKKAKGKCHPAIHFVHGLNQQEYIKYKRECFGNLFRSFHRSKNKDGWNFQDTSFGGKTIKGTSDTCIDFYEFLNFKKETLDETLLQKYLSPVSLAFWIADDGSLIGNDGKTEKTKVIRIHSYGFNYKSHIILQTILKEKFDLDVNIKELNRFGKHYYYLEFNSLNTLKLIALIKDYIHPTLYYKIYTKIELCNFIYSNVIPKFIDLGNQVQDLLQPVKLLSKEKVYKKSWTMYDVEVADNHNFFASGLLISNSYMSAEGTEKRIDAGSSLGYIERISGIPDLRIGSPLTKILSDKKLKRYIWRLPQFVRPDWSDAMREKRIAEYNGQNSSSYKLNVEAEIMEGAEGFWDIDRLKEKCYNPKRKVKVFEVSKDSFSKFKSNIIVERMPGTEKVFICSDIGLGGSASQIIIIFKVGDKYKYVYNIPLFKLIQKEQAEVFKWLYDVLGGAFIAIDATGDGGVINDYLFDMGVPQECLLKVKFNENIEIDFEKDPETGYVITDKNGEPVMKKMNTLDFAMQEMEKIFYEGMMEVPQDENFFEEFNGFYVKMVGTRKSYGSNTSDHKHQSFQVFAVCRYFNEFNELKTVQNQPRCYGVI